MKSVSCMLLLFLLVAPVSAATHPSQAVGKDQPSVIVWEVGTLLKHFLSIRISGPDVPVKSEVGKAAANGGR